MDTNQELKQRILSVLRAPKYRPLAKADLAKVLGRKSGVRMGLNQALRELERDGEIACIRKNRYVLPETADLVTGKLQVHQAGFGFLVSEKDGRARHLHRGGKYRNGDEWRSRGGADHARS